MSWNTGGRRSVDEQLAAVGKRNADIVCLQEVRLLTGDGLRRGLRELGLVYCVDSVPSIADGDQPKHSRQTGELIASRWSSQRVTGPDIPWPEKAQSVAVATPAAPIEVHTVHVPPGSSNGWIKVRTFKGTRLTLAALRA